MVSSTTLMPSLPYNFGVLLAILLLASFLWYLFCNGTSTLYRIADGG